MDEQIRASLPDLFKQKGSLQTLRPLYLQEFGRQKEPSDPNRSPKLLSRLEALLHERLALVDRMAAARKGFAVTQFRTDAYRQVFDAFLHSFTTYRSLLLRIKHEYDKGLDDALASVYDNVLMNAELVASAQRQETALHEAEVQAQQFNAAMFAELQAQLDEAQMKLSEEESRWHRAEAELEQYQADIADLAEQARQLSASNSSMQLQLLAQSTWTSPHLAALITSTAAQAAPPLEDGHGKDDSGPS